MSYVQKNLLAGEASVYDAKIHWFLYVPGILILLIGVFLMNVSSGPQDEGLVIVGLLILPFGLYSLIKAAITQSTTELAVTTKRVIAKVGFIRRNTIELNHQKVESFNVDQSVVGRIFGYGTITVNGTGGGKTPVPGIAKPLEYRRRAMETIDSAQ